MKFYKVLWFFPFLSLTLLGFSLALKIKENYEIKKEAEELITLFEPSFESILNALYFIDELYYENMKEISQIITPSINKDSLLKLALLNNFFEITVINKRGKVLLSTRRKKGEGIDKYLIQKGKEESIKGDSLFYFSDKGSYGVLLVKDIRDLKEKKRKAGLKKMLEKVSKEKRIEYIALESEGEVIFSSKKIEPLREKGLIERIINKNEILIRERMVSDENVLEVLKAFFFRENPVGILRLGISLDRFRNRILILNLILISGVLTLILSIFLIFAGLKEKSLVLPSRILKDYSIYRIEKEGLKRIYGEELRPDFEFFKDGRQFLYRKNGSYYLAYKGEKFIIFIKIDELMNIFKEKEKRREEESILRVLSSFAHEIKNPLNSLKLIIYRLKERIGEDYKELEKSLNSLTDSIEEFMNLLRPFYLKKEKVKIKEFIEDICKKLEMELREKGIDVEIAGVEKEVLMDREQMKKVFMNLIKNAIEAQPEGGKIDIKIFDERGRICVSIKDYGIGIKKENLDRIFEPYFTTKKKGTGLGLFTVKRILESHGFDINVISEEGKGTEFIIKT